MIWFIYSFSFSISILFSTSWILQQYAHFTLLQKSLVIKWLNYKQKNLSVVKFLKIVQTNSTCDSCTTVQNSSPPRHFSVRHLLSVVRHTAGSLKGWSSSPRGSLALFSKAWVCGTLVSVHRNNLRWSKSDVSVVAVIIFEQQQQKDLKATNFNTGSDNK